MKMIRPTPDRTSRTKRDDYQGIQRVSLPLRFQCFRVRKLTSIADAAGAFKGHAAASKRFQARRLSPVISDGCGRPIIARAAWARCRPGAPSAPERARPVPRAVDEHERHRIAVVWAVNGPPSSASILSALPWSAVTSATPPLRSMAASTRPTPASTASTAARGRVHDAGMPHHVAVGKVHDVHIGLIGVDGRCQGVGHFGLAHLRLQIVGGHLGARDEASAPPLPSRPRGRRSRRRSRGRTSPSRRCGTG